MRPIITLLLLAVAQLSLQAQRALFYPAERLSSSVITAIMQDRDGLLWIGTEHGLNRFDGYTFTPRLTSEKDSISRPSAISSLFTDSKGRLWVGTSKGLWLHDRATDGFRQVAFDDSIQPRVKQFTETADGHLLIGTAGYGLFSIDEATMQAVSNNSFDAASDHFYFNHLYLSSDGCLWKSGADTEFSCRRADGKLISFKSTCGPVMNFYERNGQSYVLCQYGIAQLDHQKGIASLVTSSNVFLSCMAMDAQGNLFLGTHGNGIYWMPAGTQQMQPLNVSAKGVNLSRARIEALFFDHLGNLWAGCSQKGLLMVSQRQSPLFQTWSFAAQGHETGTCVSAIAKGDDGKVWCVVQGDGIYAFDHEGNIVAHPDAPQGVETLLRDSEGNYWVGNQEGLWSYQPATGRSSLMARLHGEQVNAIAELPGGLLAVSSYSAGLYLVSKATGAVVRHLTMSDNHRPENDCLCNDWIHALDTDRQGRLWIGTSSGVCCYDPKRDTFLGEGWAVLADRQACHALRVLSNGDVLLGLENGLQRWSRAKGLIPEEGTEPMHGRTVSFIAEDRHNDIWMSTNDGIWQWNPRTPMLIAYVGAEGLRNREFVLGSGQYTTDGHIFLGTSDGITSFATDSVRNHKPQVGDVRLTAFIIGGEHANMHTRSNGRQVMDKPLNECHHFRLSYVDAFFELEFSLLDFADAADVSFEYHLNNERRWQTTGKGNNVITFNHLAPGTYRLQVRALRTGVYSQVATYVIEVRPPWWLSTLAYIIYILLMIAALGAAGYLYRRRMRRQLDEDKMQFLINATHDIRSPLTLILSPLEKLRQRITAPDDREDLDIIQHNAQRILGLVNQILDIRKIDRQQMQLHPTDVDFTALVGAICHMHDFAARERRIDFRFLHPDTPITAHVDAQQMEKVVANLLSNAFKFTTDGGEIIVEVSEGPAVATAKQQRDSKAQAIFLTVTDNGTGIAPSALPHIFDRFYQSRQTSHQPGTGIGLHLCRMIVDMHEGHISAQNRPDGKTGSRFVVELKASSPQQATSPLPVNRDHLASPDGGAQPASAIEAGEQQEGRQGEAPQPTTKIGGSGLVLLVDDDTELSAYVAHELAPHYRCHTASNGQEALQLLLTADEGTFAAVVSDVMMPEMDGFTLLRLIRTNQRIATLPVIMLTSKDDVASRLEGLERGADAYLSKPFSTTELTATLRNLLAQRQRLRGKYSGAQQAAASRVELPEQKGNDEALMDRIVASVNRHLSDSEFSVEQLCSEAGISRAHLHRKMKEMTGLPVTEFIRGIRLEQAARLLREQKLNVTQVAYSVGFSSLGYFSTVFRKHFGMSPRDFAEKKD